MKVSKSYQKFFKDKSRLVLLYGGAGSGKSYSAQQKIIMRMTTEDGHKFLVVRKVARTLKNSVYDLFVTIIANEGLQTEFTCTTTPMEITHNKTANKIIFLGLDDSEKLKSIADITGIFIEEATEICEDDFLQINLRLRGNTKFYKQIIMCFNPISMASFIYLKFFKEQIYKASIYHTTYKDNPFIDKEYKEQLEALSDQNEMYSKVYKSGEWASLEDTIVFRNYEIKDLDQDISKYRILSVGVDFGFSHASTAILFAVTDTHYLILKEVYKKNLTNPEFINIIKWELPFWKELVFFGDSAEPARMKEFRNNGIDMLGVKKGKGSVGFAIDFLLRKQILVDRSCVQTIEELGTFKYLKDERTGIIFPDKFENDGLYDCLAALRYAVNRMMRKTKTMKAVSRL